MTTVENDAWDDELLIQEYNRSVRLVDQRMEEIQSTESTGDLSGIVGAGGGSSSNAGGGKKDKRFSKKKSDSIELLWKPGDHCVATFKDDGIDYEAKIISIDHKYGCCVVKYLGYDNEELQYLQDLKPTGGLASQLAQMKLFLNDDAIEPEPEGEPDNQETQCDQEEERESIKPTFILPPPPAFLTSNLSDPPSKEHDALASMLMSWYMCGYQTGYYTALRQIKGKD